MAVMLEMSMPKCCSECKLTYVSYDDDDHEYCFFYRVDGPVEDLDGRHPNCPIRGEIASALLRTVEENVSITPPNQRKLV